MAWRSPPSRPHSNKRAYGVFLLDHFRLAKRIVHADQQYAGMGAEDHAGEPGALFRGGDAYGLFKGAALRFTGTFVIVCLLLFFNLLAVISYRKKG